MARLYKRGRTYYSDVYIPGHPKADKKGRVRVPLDTDQRIALRKLDDLIGQGDAAKFGRPAADISYKEFKLKFLAWVKANKSKATYVHDRVALKLLEKHETLDRLADITPEKLEHLQGTLRENKAINSLVNRRIRSIKAMMRKAEAWGYVEPKKWETITQFPEPKGRLLFYTVEEMRKLLKKCLGVWKTVALLGARAGLRRSEIYWLDWESVDMARNRVHIAPRYDEAGTLLWSPKDHERRWIPMATDLLAHLKGLPRPARWVIEQEGERPGLETMSTYFKKISRKAGLRGGIHVLRHSFASHLASSGKVTLREIKELLGHSTIEQTEAYAHLVPERVESAITHLPEF